MPTHQVILYSNHRFDVEVVPGKNTPKEIAACTLALSSVSPLRATCEPNAVTNNKPVQPGTSCYDKLELRRALTTDKFLFTWRDNWTLGIQDYRDIKIRQLAVDTGEPVNQWLLFECWPCLWEGPGFDAMHSEISYERLEIYFSRMEWR